MIIKHTKYKQFSSYQLKMIVKANEISSILKLTIENDNVTNELSTILKLTIENDFNN